MGPCLFESPYRKDKEGTTASSTANEQDVKAEMEFRSRDLGAESGNTIRKKKEGRVIGKGYCLKSTTPQRCRHSSLSGSNA